MSISLYKLRYQVAPIILTGGIAQTVPGGMISLLAASNPQMILAPLYSQGVQQDFLDALFTPSSSAAGTIGTITSATVTEQARVLDDAFGAFNVLAGGTLCAQTVPKYPLADMTMAANAIVRDPLTLSLIWDAPMRGFQTNPSLSAWDIKLAVMQALKGMLDRHNNLGGLYSVMTPAFYYENLILVALTDNSRGGNPLPQNAWRFDFERPMVVNLTDLNSIGYGAPNMMMRKLIAGTPSTGQLSGYTIPAISSPTAEPPFTPGSGQIAPTTPALAGVPTPLP
jgi:hypothetical protein